LIARDDRLRRNDEFDRVRSQGRSYSARHLVLVVLPNELSQNRYGFAAGKRLGNAVRRNRAKRLMREAIRAEQPHLTPGFDVVIIARNSFPQDLKLDTVAEQLGSLLTKSGLRVVPSETSDTSTEPEASG